VGLTETKNQQEETLTKHVGFVYPHIKKANNRKIKDEKDGDKQNRQDSYSTMKTRAISVRKR